MKVLFTARYSLFSQPGGDTQQVVQTAEALRELGHSVSIILHGEPMDFDAFDIVHFFNLGRPADMVDALHLLKKPLVVSSIWVDYREYDKQRSGLAGIVLKVLGANGLEYFKTIARGLNGSDKWPGLLYLTRGHGSSLRILTARSAAIITSSASEKKRVCSYFGLAETVHHIPLGLPAAFLHDFEPAERSGALCVGRIEGLKNQLNLIKAANGANWELKIIGKPAANQPEYFKHCQQAAGKNVHFVGWLDTENLLEAYRSAKVLVLPSYFETFGLVALEALSQGCNVVIAERPDMNSIFNDRVLRCNPNNPADIKEKIEAALQLPPADFTSADKQKYAWREAALQIESIYKNVSK